MRAESNFYVYVHSRLSSGDPFYVGKGYGSRSTSTRGRNAYWRRIVEKDGGHHTSFVARGIDNELALLLEIEMIDKYRRMGAALTNATNGGEGTTGYELSTETKRKISAKAVGRQCSEETRKRMSESRKGKPGTPLTEERKKQLLATHLGIPHPCRGIPMSEESKQKMRKAWETRRLTPESAETRLKKSLANKGKIKSAETIARLSATKTGRKLSAMSLQLRRERIATRMTEAST